MSKLLVTLKTHQDTVSAGNWLNFTVKLQKDSLPRKFEKITGVKGMKSHTVYGFQTPEIPELSNRSQIEFFHISHHTKTLKTYPRWDATVQVDMLSPDTLLSAYGPRRFHTKHSEMRIHLKRIALQASTGHFVSVSQKELPQLIINNSSLKETETFELVESDNQISLRAYNGCFVSVTNNETHNLIANSFSIGIPETFTLVDLGKNRILGSKLVALKTCHGQFVAVEHTKQGELLGNRSERGVWETFTLFQV